MTDEYLPAGYYFRYLPRVYEWGYDEAKKASKELSLPEYVATLDDTGEERAVRVYEEAGREPLIMFVRTLIGDGIPRGEKEVAIESFSEDLLRRVFERNRLQFDLRGIGEFDATRLTEKVYGIPVETYLSSYWYLLERVELFEIGDRELLGFAETDRGRVLLESL